MVYGRWGSVVFTIRNFNVVLATAGFHSKCIDRRIPLPTEDFEIDERLGDDGQNEG